MYQAQTPARTTFRTAKYYSTAIQLRRIDSAIEILKDTLQKPRSVNFMENTTALNALKSVYDCLEADLYLKHDRSAIELCVKQLKDVNTEWQNFFYETKYDDNDLNAYFEKLHDENGILAVLREADDQLFNICTSMELVEKQRNYITFGTFTAFPTMFIHESIIPNNSKILQLFNQFITKKLNEFTNPANVPIPVIENEPITVSSTPIIESVDILRVVDETITVFSAPVNDLPLVNIIIDNSIANDTYTATAKTAIKCPTTTTAATTTCHLQMPDYNLAEKSVATTYDPMVIINFIAKFEAALTSVEHQNVHFSSVWEGYPRYECSSTSDFLQISEIAQQFLLKMLRLMFTCHATTFGCSFTFVPCSTPITFQCSQNPTLNYPNNKIN